MTYKVFNPIPKEHYDVSVLQEHRAEIEMEYKNNIESYQNVMDSMKNSIVPAEGVRMNLSGELPTNPMKTLRPIKIFAEGWTSSWIAYNNEFYAPVKKYFPLTYEILNSFGNVFYAHFSSIAPGGKIKVHKGNEKLSVMRSQWCFIAPTQKKCYIGASETFEGSSNKDIFYYTENSSFWFDDSKCWHWVENNTEEERVVLLIDYWTNLEEKQNFDYYIYYNNVASVFNRNEEAHNKEFNRSINYESN